MKIAYYDHHGPRNQPGFRGGGTAWWVRSDPERPWDEHFAEFDISEQLYWAIFHLGIIDDLAELPYSGLLGAYEEGILLASALADAPSFSARGQVALLKRPTSGVVRNSSVRISWSSDTRGCRDTQARASRSRRLLQFSGFARL